MQLINWLLSMVVQLLNTLIPVLGLPENFTNQINGAVTIIVDLINGASYFLPINTMLVCFAVLLIVDNWVLVARIGQWILRLIRG